MDKYSCTMCGYEYDPKVGNIPKTKPLTAFKDLPDDWMCPNAAWAKKFSIMYKKTNFERRFGT